MFLNSHETIISGVITGLSITEWQAAAEMEAVLNVTRSACFLSQYETCYTGGYSACLKQLQIDTLRSGKLSVVELSAVGTNTSLERSTRMSSDLTAIGKTTMARALTESQRRYCRKAAECSNDDEKYAVKLSKQDHIATMLDPRLCHAAHLRPEGVDDAKNAFRREYVKYAKTAIMFGNKMAQTAADAKGMDGNDEAAKVHTPLAQFITTTMTTTTADDVTMTTKPTAITIFNCHHHHHHHIIVTSIGHTYVS